MESKRTRRLKKAISREKKKKREEEVVVVVVVVGGGGEVEEVKLMIDLCGELLRRKRKRSLSVDGNQYAGGGKTRRRDALRLQGHLQDCYETGFYVLWSLDLLLGVGCSAVFGGCGLDGVRV